MNDVKLKPCPFCGGEAELYVENGVTARCKLCYCGTPFRTDFGYSKKSAIETVIEAWNRRKHDE